MILVFAGAGASKAVRPERYPTTVEFFERLPEDVTGDLLFRYAVDYLKSRPNRRDVLDIEQVLWLTRELNEFASRAADSASILGWFLNENRLSGVGGVPQISTAHLPGIALAASQRIDTLSSRINSLVYDLYGDKPSESELADNWLQLLAGLMETGSQIELVTTNYDIVIEEAITLSRAPVLTGRVFGNQPTLDTSLWDLHGLQVESFSSYGRLTKLHGSVDWARGRDRIFVGTPMFHGRHERHAIIYPGFKGTPQDPLFQALHRYFEERLSQVEIAIFVGYAFRDEYINTLLDRSMRRSARVLILNPADRLATVPFAEARFEHVKEGFNPSGVGKVIASVHRSLH